MSLSTRLTIQHLFDPSRDPPEREHATQQSIPHLWTFPSLLQERDQRRQILPDHDPVRDETLHQVARLESVRDDGGEERAWIVGEGHGWREDVCGEGVEEGSGGA